MKLEFIIFAVLHGVSRKFHRLFLYHSRIHNDFVEALPALSSLKFIFIFAWIQIDFLVRIKISPFLHYFRFSDENHTNYFSITVQFITEFQKFYLLSVRWNSYLYLLSFILKRSFNFPYFLKFTINIIKIIVWHCSIQKP